MSIKTISRLILAGLYLATLSSEAQIDQKQDVFVDSEGIMRWGDTNEEVHGFGVNYSAPFAHVYRSAEKKGIDIRAEIDKDIYHFTRLGFDLYRLHVWDTEISDENGNLLANDHLDTFDYLLKQLKERDINFVITPIAFWGNGWPEPDQDTPGFSNKYGKEKSLTNPEAIRAQENYLTQFMNHVNPYTGVAYKEEPNLIAIEVSNEPHHRGSEEEVKNFINKMVQAIRKSGTEKPIFYNVSHSIQLAEAYFDADIQGGTFQWYPTGLGFQQELEGNLLPNVNEYRIPFEEVIKKNHAAKLVYEFDAADVNKSYMYPAMARSFREAGIQVATHFAYDPTFLAYANTEYNTHYMNLNYTPHKALALMIASEIFHEVELGKNQGAYPDNLKFEDFEISYENDLATYNSEEKFIYTNSNNLALKNEHEVKQISGQGSSEVVKYEGKGAYFLDKLKEGMWRLEVMPDPFLIQDPFGKNSLDKTVAVIKWAKNEMRLNLKDLGENFEIEGLNPGNELSHRVEGDSFEIEPGTYLLKKENSDFNMDTFQNRLRFKIDRFEAQKETVDKTYFLHHPVAASIAGDSLKIEATVVSDDTIEKVEAWFKNGNSYETANLTASDNYDYQVKVPEKLLKQGNLEYRVVVTTNNGKITFPGGVSGSPDEWDFYSSEIFEVPIYAKDSPVYLFNAAKDSEKVVRSWSPKNNVIPINDLEQEFQIQVDSLFTKDPENTEVDPIYDYSFRYNFTQKIGNIDLDKKNKLIIKARNLNKSTEKLQVALLMKNGAAFGKIIELKPEVEEIQINISDLKPVKTVTLPRPYPGFLPYYFQHDYKGPLELKDVESIQFSIGPGIEPVKLQQPHAIGIRSVRIQ